MKVNIIQIGNSRGIRIPATVLTQCHIGNQVDMHIENGRIVLIPVKKKIRDNWDIEMKQMAESGDDEQLIADFFNEELNEFEW